ncbi:mannitol dehydrogenase [Salinicola endophyticus]|uniref:Mannitol dehydrogenase n=1 Tax=Salinicola endophyticus TaxID=1949083 RepID=A0ABY8FB58_9GAMM|nr:mannitol dehydrogenase [Salinicola endophyticus]WFF40053.1 mannitol dehydrogenase [Salinicola endophyticus]
MNPPTDALDSQASIVQFGTGRFLLAHVDALVSESLASGASSRRLLVVQSSPREEGKRKARLLAAQRRYPLQIRGRRDGVEIDREQHVDSIDACLIAAEQWQALTRHVVEHAEIIVSNTADNGFEVGTDSSLAPVPASYPGKLTQLLRARFDAGRDGLTILPCELIEHNASELLARVTRLARQDGHPDAFVTWLETRCVWADTLVDRIVSAPLEPLGAIAEPYALWAIARRPGLTLPCVHADVEVVDDLRPAMLRKLHILNLAHSVLVHHWQRLGQPVATVREAMQRPELSEPLRALLDDEVLPTLAAELPLAALERYRDVTLERFANPFLDHRLADIAQHHATKLERRLRPVVEQAERQGRRVPGLIDALGGAN